MKTAWELHKVSAVAMSVAVVVLYICHGVSVLTEAVLHMVPKAGHWHIEPAIRVKLIEACDLYKTL